MERTNIGIKGSRKETCGMIRTRWLTHALKYINKRRRNWQQIEKKDCAKKEEIGDCSSLDPYKMETMLEEGRGGDDEDDNM
jgi:hypothetical protein